MIIKKSEGLLLKWERGTSLAQAMINTNELKAACFLGLML